MPTNSAFLFVTAYRYRHVNQEVWDGRCLERIETATDSNGKELSVKGVRESTGFIIDAGEDVRELPECVMSFAYWNPAFLEQSRLLNSQDGEFLDVEVSLPVAESLEVRGEQRAAYRYRLAAGELRLDLWYSADREWLGLESEVRGGRKLRYELM